MSAQASEQDAESARRMRSWAEALAGVKSGRLTIADAERQWAEDGVELPWSSPISTDVSAWWRPSHVLIFAASRSAQVAQSTAPRLEFWGERLVQGEPRPERSLSLIEARRELLVALGRGTLVASGIRSGETVRCEIPSVEWLDLDLGLQQGAAIHGGFRDLIAPPWRDVRFSSSALIALWPGKDAPAAAARPEASKRGTANPKQSKRKPRLRHAVATCLIEIYGEKRPALVSKEMQFQVLTRLGKDIPDSVTSTFKDALKLAWPD